MDTQCNCITTRSVADSFCQAQGLALVSSNHTDYRGFHHIRYWSRLGGSAKTSTRQPELSQVTLWHVAFNPWKALRTHMHVTFPPPPVSAVKCKVTPQDLHGFGKAILFVGNEPDKNVVIGIFRGGLIMFHVGRLMDLKVHHAWKWKGA